jgi:site-specific recombinase XerD
MSVTRPRRAARGRKQHEQTTSDLLRDFETALRQSGRAENGVQGVLTDARQLCEFAGEKSLSNLQRGDILAFIQWLERERGQKPSSLKRKLASVRLLFGFLRREGLIDANPTDGVGIVSPARQRSLPLTLTQARRLVAAASSDRRWQVLVLLMLTAGLKRDEALRLQWPDVSRDWEKGVTHISVRGTSDNARSARTLSLPSMTADALQALSNSMPIGQRHGSVLGMSARGLSYAVRQCAERAGLTHLEITPQRLRDTFAVGLLASLSRREAIEARGMSRRGQTDVRRGYEQGFLHVLGVGRNRALIDHYRAALLEREDTDGAEGVFLRDRDFASADEL